MEVQIFQNSFGKSGFEASAQGQDATPRLSRLQTNLAPSTFAEPRTGLASALAFLPDTAGKLSFHGRVTPLTAGQVQKLSIDGRLLVDTKNIQFDPSDIPQGSTSMHVFVRENLTSAIRDIEEIDKLAGESNVTGCVFVPDDAMAGYLTSPRWRIIPSNYWLYEQLADERAAFYGLLALSVFYSVDLVADTIILHTPASLGSSEQRELEHALYTVGLTLEINHDSRIS